MELNDFKSALKSGKLGGCYIFAGEEDYLKRYYLGELREKALSDPTLSAFNHSIYDGSEVNFALIRDDIKAPPMFEPYKLIEWRYPSFDKMKESDLVLFEETLELLCEYDYAILAFIVSEGDIDLGTGKRESKFVKRFKDKVNILNFAKSTDTQLMSWLKKHFDAYSVSVSASVLSELIFRSGHSMSVLKSEVDKLCFYALSNEKSEITAEDVREVASSTPECDTFALSNAILDRNKKAAFLALDEMKSERLDPLMIIGMMAKSYSELVSIMMMLRDGMGAQDITAALGMNPYRLKLYLGAAKRFTPERASRILAELTRVDTGAKFGGVTGYTAIELFISKCI